MRLDVRRIVLVGALGGLLAGMVMALTEMIYGWASTAHTAWDAPMAIWAWLVGLNYFGHTTSMVSPQRVWWLAHGLLGITLGTVYATACRMRLRPLAQVSRLREDAPRAAA
jgi:hypothetical protein